jgi:hypothetical protein
MGAGNFASIFFCTAKIKIMKKVKLVKPPIDSSAVNSQVVLASLEKEAAPIIKRLSGGIVIKSKSDLENAAVLTKQLKSLAKVAAAKEKNLTGPLEKLKKDIIALFKPFKNQILNIEGEVKDAMLRYSKKMGEKQSKLEEDFNSGKIKKIDTYTKKSVDLQFSSSSAQVRKVWEAEIVNESKIPREYLVPDMRKIEADLKEGKKIAGVNWIQKETIAI